MNARLIKLLNEANSQTDLSRRNEAAVRLLNYRRVVEAGNVTIETWWDRYSQNYVTQTKDDNGNQIGDAAYSGYKEGAAVAHLFAINAALRG